MTNEQIEKEAERRYPYEGDLIRDRDNALLQMGFEEGANFALENLKDREYLYDKIGKHEVKLWYKDPEGNFLIDLDPNGINMDGRRTVVYGSKDRYEIRYRETPPKQ